MKRTSFPRIITQGPKDILWRAGREGRIKGWCNPKRAVLRYSWIWLCRQSMENTYILEWILAKQAIHDVLIEFHWLIWCRVTRLQGKNTIRITWFLLILCHSLTLPPSLSLSFLWNPNIIEHNGILTVALLRFRHTHSDESISHSKMGTNLRIVQMGHYEYSTEGMWRVQYFNLNLIIVWGRGLNPRWVQWPH